MIDVVLESAFAPVNMLTFAKPEQILLSDEACKSSNLSCLWILGWLSMFAQWTTCLATEYANHQAVDEAKSF